MRRACAVVGLVLVSILLLAPHSLGVNYASYADYEITKISNSPFAGRNRLIVRAKMKSGTAEEIVGGLKKFGVTRFMMDIVLTVREKRPAHIINLFLKGKKGTTIGGIALSEDGCDWPKNKCNFPLWIDLLIFNPKKIFGSLENVEVPETLRWWKGGNKR